MLLKDSGGTNRTGSGTAFATNTQGGYFAATAFSGSTGSTYWNGGSSGPWALGYDFGTGNAWDIRTFSILGRTGYSSTISPIDFAIQFSDDGTNYSTLSYVSNAVYVDGTHTNFSVVPVSGTNANTHRYWRANFTASVGSGNIHLGALELQQRSNGANVTGSGTVTASPGIGAGTLSTIFTGTPNINLPYGDDWATVTFYVQYDFGSGNAFDIGALEIWPVQRDATGHYEPTAFSVSSSNDGTTWTTLAANYFSGVSWTTNTLGDTIPKNFTVSASISASPTLSGVAATSQIGTLNIKIDSNPVLNGIYATGYVGDLGVQLDCNITLTGIYATTYVGDLTNIQASSSISLTGLYATAQLGTISSQLDVFPSITGVYATPQLGTISSQLDVFPSITGVYASAQLGSLDVQLDVVINLSGLYATGQVGSFNMQYDVYPALTGLSATGQVGSFNMQYDVYPALTGLSATGQVGDLAVQLDVSPALTGLYATGQVGDLTNFHIDSNVSITGIEAVSYVGSIITEIGIGIDGVEATSDVGTLTTYIPMVNGQWATCEVGILTLSILTNSMIGVYATCEVGNLLVHVGTNRTNVNITGVFATCEVA